MAVYEQAWTPGWWPLITDGGLTEFGGVPTRTCLGIGFVYDDRVDPVPATSSCTDALPAPAVAATATGPRISRPVSRVKPNAPEAGQLSTKCA